MSPSNFSNFCIVNYKKIIQRGMTTVQDVDDITDEILGLLIQEPDFIKEWELQTMEAIEQEKVSDKCLSSKNTTENDQTRRKIR